MNDLQAQLRYRRGIIALTLAGVNLLALLVFLGDRRDLINPVWIYLSLYPIAFGLFIYAACKTTALSEIRPNNRTLLWAIIGFAIIFRLVVVHAIPSLSTDIYRYVWDGRLTCHWINPYRWSPWDPRLAGFRDSKIWMPMEYKAYATVYMPISQLFFAISYAIFRTDLYGYKLVFTLFDIGIVFLISELLKTQGKDPTRVIWYAWCPLPIIETSLAGHQDVIGVFLMVFAVLLAAKNRKIGSGLAIAAAAMTKGFALLIMPLLGRLCGRRAIITAVLALFYLAMPAWVYLPEFLHGMNQYLDNVHVNSGLFALIDWVLSFVTSKYHFILASRITDLMVIGITLWSISSPVTKVEEVIRRAIIVIAVCLFTVPTLFPWYVVWLLPFVAVFGRRPSVSIITLAGVVDLVYVYYIDRAVRWWLPIIEYAPVFALIFWEWRRGYWSPESPDADGVLSVSPLADEVPADADLRLSRGANAT